MSPASWTAVHRAARKARKKFNRFFFVIGSFA